MLGNATVGPAAGVAKDGAIGVADREVVGDPLGGVAGVAVWERVGAVGDSGLRVPTVHRSYAVARRDSGGCIVLRLLVGKVTEADEYPVGRCGRARGPGHCAEQLFDCLVRTVVVVEQRRQRAIFAAVRPD